MPTPKLEVRHYKSAKGQVFMVYRYYDDKNKNFEYQVYELVQTKKAMRLLGIEEFKKGRKEPLNAREMGDDLFEKKKNFQSIIPENGRMK